jgi:predicted RND superfamily exporter protein
VRGTLYAGVLVTALAIVMLRRPLYVALALVPMALGTLWTVGCMPLLGMTFNLANVWGLPLLIGASAEYGFNVVLQYRQRSADGDDPFPRSGVVAVVLNGLTTMASFGSLMVARHQGIFGLGLLLTIGTAAALVTSLVLVPVLLSLADGGKGRRCEPAG